MPFDGPLPAQQPYISVGHWVCGSVTFKDNTMKSMTNRHQIKNWYLTYLDSQQKINGPALLLEELVKRLESYTPYYGICCKEKAPSTGTTHYHILICCQERCRTRNLDIIEINDIKPHVERVNNNLRRIINYIKKEGEFAEFNADQCPVKKEQESKEEKRMIMLRGKLEEEYIKGTLGPVDVIRARKIRQIFAMERKPDPYKKKLVLWFKGDTGEGKTRSAVELAERYNLDWWMSSESLKWFDGFEGQQVAIIDEFRKTMLSEWSFLLRLLDGYSLFVQVKGGFTRWNPQIVVITTPASPEECFSWVDKDGQTKDWDRMEQLIRRLTYKDQLQVYEFPLWDDEKERLKTTVEDFLGINNEVYVEDELSMSPILPEPSQNDEA